MKPQLILVLLGLLVISGFFASALKDFQVIHQKFQTTLTPKH